MTSRTASYTTCPLQPRVDPSRLINPADPLGTARIPPYACNRDQCQLWMRALDQTGHVVAEYCAFVGLVAGVGQLGSILLSIGSRHDLGHTGPNNSPPPTA